MCRVSLESNAGNSRRSSWGMKDEEYTADFCLVAQRSLSLREHQIFRYHYLLGADWKLCCQKLKLLRGEFFHDVYRIEQKLGRVFRELEPHALFPVDEYFNGTGRYQKQMFECRAEGLPELGDDQDGDDIPFTRLLRFPIKTVAAGSGD